MSEQMIRKQIYLPRRQNLALRRLAKERGVSEAEVIRQALERESEAEASVVRGNLDGWAGVLQFVHERNSEQAADGKAYEWNRMELYEARENRWLKTDGENI